ncbi:DUF1127 domain-containing protein [Actibacterium sp. 188UL27-1]|uniref:DUF1127 domain-containing protein n=1 Tax=Actibacterium sp. 188UL27-1 TaxID=2786961 RepID=UPI0019578E3F|nr:DUF1127 domain-containing protein [Actibacterium sp. 188UL27-1]MBM7067504.1 DUF1127 domain-containing protein [Actibacterium sp. 188UL27-1]
MATTFEHAGSTAGPAWTTPFRTVFNMLIRMGERHPFNRQIEALCALSDAELAERGITRQQIASYVMGARAML